MQAKAADHLKLVPELGVPPDAYRAWSAGGGGADAPTPRREYLRSGEGLRVREVRPQPTAQERAARNAESRAYRSICETSSGMASPHVPFTPVFTPIHSVDPTVQATRQACSLAHGDVVTTRDGPETPRGSLGADRTVQA